MKKISGIILAVMLVFGSVGMAGAVVVNFDDLVGQALVPNGYGGINWNDEWTYYGWTQDPYNPSSPPVRVYDFVSEGKFDFVTPDQTFNGAWFSGVDTTTVKFNLYNDGILVASTLPIFMSNVPTFLDSGYSGLVDVVGVLSNAPDFFVMDDVTYGGHQVPEPATLMLFGVGLVGVGIARRLRRQA